MQSFVEEYSATETDKVKLEKLVYINIPDFTENGRLIYFTKKKTDLQVNYQNNLVQDLLLDKLNIDSWLLQETYKDGVNHLVKCGAKWKLDAASSKQKEFVSKILEKNKIYQNIDLETLSKGEASSLIEQSKWVHLIHQKFGTDCKENLLGYDRSQEDI